MGGPTEGPGRGGRGGARKGAPTHLHHHPHQLRLDVGGLVTHRHLGHAWQVDQREVEHPRRADAQPDRLGRHVERLAQLALRLRLDLLADLAKVGEALARQVGKLAPLARLAALGVVQQLQQQRPPRADAGTARQEVVADEALQHRRLAAALTADHDNLRQGWQLTIIAQRRQRVLELVEDREEPLHTTWRVCRPVRWPAQAWRSGGVWTCRLHNLISHTFISHTCMSTPTYTDAIARAEFASMIDPPSSTRGHEPSPLMVACRRCIGSPSRAESGWITRLLACAASASRSKTCGASRAARWGFCESGAPSRAPPQRPAAP